MKTMKTLMLAAAAAVSIGAGAAMAQDGPSTTSDYWASKNLQVQPRQVAPRNSVGDFRSFWLHATPSRDNATVGGDGSAG